MEMSMKSGDGIFADLGCAFLDRVDLSLTVPPRLRPWPLMIEKENKPSFGKDSFYGRYCSGILEPTGNPFQVHYSKMTRLPRVPHSVLRMDSERSPLTTAELCLAARSLTGKPEAATVAYVEVTWDLLQIFGELDKRLVSRRTRHRERWVNPRDGRRSHYFGGRKSERYVILYEKPPQLAPRVVRLEIRLGSRALRRLKITHLDELLLLRRVDFTDLVSICDLHVPKSVVPERWRRNLWRYFAERQALDELAREFATYYPVPRKKFLRPTPLDAVIRQMQSRLVC
jgi:hypothetical protein